MKLKRLKKLSVLAVSALIAAFSAQAALADDESLDSGSVQGIPDGLFVCDDQGYAVPESGEYFVEIEDMQPCVKYTKTVEIQNLIENEYSITMAAEPVSNEGNLDLEANTNVKLYLDGDLIYDGKVTGDGTVNMTDTPIDLGTVESGASKTLVAEFYWDGSGFKNVEGQEYTAECQFKWIFEAAVRVPYDSTSTSTSVTTESTPNTGSQTLLWVGVIGGLAVMIVLFVVIARQNSEVARKEEIREAEIEMSVKEEENSDKDKD